MKAEKKSIWNSRLFRDSVSAGVVVMVVLVITEVSSHFSNNPWIWHIQG